MIVIMIVTDKRYIGKRGWSQQQQQRWAEMRPNENHKYCQHMSVSQTDTAPVKQHNKARLMRRREAPLGARLLPTACRPGCWSSEKKSSVSDICALTRDWLDIHYSSFCFRLLRDASLDRSLSLACHITIEVRSTPWFENITLFF